MSFYTDLIEMFRPRLVEKDGLLRIRDFNFGKHCIVRDNGKWRVHITHDIRADLFREAARWCRKQNAKV